MEKTYILMLKNKINNISRDKKSKSDLNLIFKRNLSLNSDKFLLNNRNLSLRLRINDYDREKNILNKILKIRIKKYFRILYLQYKINKVEKEIESKKMLLNKVNIEYNQSNISLLSIKEKFMKL